MPPIVAISPEERLSGLAASPGTPRRHLITGLPRYFCPHCEQHTVYKPTLAPEPSVFPPEIKQLFDAATPKVHPSEGGSSDFFCRVCRRPVRVIYSIDEFHMASYHFYADCVLETAKDED